MARRAPVLGILLGLALIAPVAIIMPSSIPSTPAPRSVQLHLYGSATAGWGLSAAAETNPGPTLSTNKGDVVTLWLTSSDGLPHEFTIDYNANGIPDSGEPTSPAFTTDVNFTFTPVVAGTFTYRCSFHPATMTGTWTVNAPPQSHVDAPGTGADWTGGTPHPIVYTVTDDGPLANVKVWLNYSYNGGVSGGTIAGPLTPTAGPNVVTWTPGRFNATDTIVNVMAVDALGAKGYALSPPIIVDSTLPIVSTVIPSSNATGVPIDAVVEVQWSEPMNLTSVATPITVSLREVLSGAYVSGSFGWVSLGVTLDVTPDSPLKPLTLYELRVNTSAMDASSPGNPMAAAFTRRFTTVAGTDAIAPTVAAPTVTQVSATAIGGTVNITVSVTDNVDVRNVSISVSSEALSVNETFAMLHAGGSTFYLNRSFSAGTYDYSIRGTDNASNAAYRNGAFTVSAETATSPNPTPFDYVPWIAAGLLAIGAVGTALLLLRRRKPGSP
ncbi:MAG TPA: Ig-like domain-containing protein [Thermoplasmata archaeon]|nr:Ig-like domain-containing protein [Thermoplasmata archaeon]